MDIQKKAFNQAAIAQEITVSPFNATPIAADDLISKKAGSLISKLETSPYEIKARKAALQDTLLHFLDILTPNGRERCASLVGKESYKILKDLVTIPGKLKKWIGSRGIWAHFDPPKIIARNLIPLEIAPNDITSSKSYPHIFIPSIASEDLMLMNAQEIKKKIETEIGPYL